MLPISWYHGRIEREPEKDKDRKYYPNRGATLGGNTTSYKGDGFRKSYPKRGSSGLSLSRGSNFVYSKKRDDKKRGKSFYHRGWR